MKNPFKFTKEEVGNTQSQSKVSLPPDQSKEVLPKSLSRKSLKDLFTTTSPKDRRTSVLLARIFLFAIAAVWILIYLAVILITYDKLFWPAMNVYFINSVKQDTTFNHVMVNICCAWYLITVFALGIWIAFKSFKLVGVWEPKNRKNTKEEGKEYLDEGPTNATGK